MELLIPIVLLLLILSFCMRFVLGGRVYGYVKAMFVYDIIKGLIMLPFRVCSSIFRLLKIR